MLAVWGAALRAEDTAVIAAQSFWDYAQLMDRALPGVSVGSTTVVEHCTHLPH